MTLAILSLLGAIVPFVIWLIQRRLAQKADPIEQHREQYDAIQKPVAPAADTHLSDELDELERLQNARDRK